MKQDWIHKQLNWFWTLLMLGICCSIAILNMIIDSVFLADTVIPVVFAWTAFIILCSAFYASVGWVLVQKGRSLVWIHLSGLFSHLWLSNKRRGVLLVSAGS